MRFDVSVIGAGVVDVMVGAADEKIMLRPSTPMDFVNISFGGDALNEAIVLSRFGRRVQWISKVGDDDAGRRILDCAAENSLSVADVKIQSGLDSAVNIVLVDSAGERHFLTNPRSSLRRLSPDDIPPVEMMAPVVSFASMFVSPLMDIPSMTRLFRAISESGRTLVVDTTRAKNRETLDDIAELLPSIDFFLPNESELATLTGSDDTFANIAALMRRGLKCAIVKRGGKGCVIAHGSDITTIDAFPVEKVIDTTGAGDCFAAGFISVALIDGLPLSECGRFACATASIAVEHVGATTGVQSLTQVRGRCGGF